MLDKPIRNPDEPVTSEKTRASATKYYERKKAEKRAIALAKGARVSAVHPGTGIPVNGGKGRPRSIVNRVTEYGALFNRLNEERMEKGLPQLMTAMEVLIEAMQSDEIELRDKAKIAEKLATFESSRAPIISIEHIQNVNKEDDLDADMAMKEFLEALHKV